ncbi:MAG: SDR family oxidoreductase [Melioribacteraceae bacterium]|nr:SDR family oxidoreductase [Melioribacteraceae bacterium]
MKILFVGGTGIISSACSELCLEKGYDLFLLNRGESIRKAPDGVKQITADINNIEQCKSLLKEHQFDSVVSWIAYTPEHVKRDLEIFSGITSQYIFISSASAYAKPPAINLNETHKIWNPVWEYSQNKVLCERYLEKVYSETNFPITIVRPSHTYDKTTIPLQGHYTTLARLFKGKEVIIHGDGTTLWTLTHHKDFAKGFVPLLGNKKTIGETYHITGDEHLTWDQICKTMANAAGVEAKIVHVPSDYIMKHDKDWGDGLLGDKAYNMVLDNSKIKSIAPEFKCEIPFAKGAKEIVKWYKENESTRTVDKELEKLMDELVLKFK